MIDEIITIAIMDSAIDGILAVIGVACVCGAVALYWLG